MSEVVVDPNTKVKIKNRGTYMKMLAVGTVFLLLIGGGGAYYWWQKSATEKAATSQGPARTVAADDATLSKRLADAKTAEDKSEAYIAIAQANIVKEDFAQAKQSAQQAVDADESIAAYLTLGLSAVQAGDKQTAVAAYRKAAELSRKLGTEQGNFNAQSYEILAAGAERS